MKIGILGCSGRMGRTLLNEVLEHPDCTLSGGVEREGSSAIGSDLGMLAGREALGMKASADVAALCRESDAIIDFTAPEATLAVGKLAAEHNTIHVIGTTGFTPEQKAELAALGQKNRIVQAPNMSVCVNLFLKVVEQVAGILDESFDIEIVEMHHNKKVDAPSGTALRLGEAAAKGRGINHDANAVLTREGQTGPREPGTIGYATLRGGDVVGDHTVMFAGPGERLELTHKASDRRIYARGAIRAAIWARKQPNGLYSMFDVLGL